MGFNKDLAISYGSSRFVIAFDPSYISKTGKHTPGVGRYWSGCAQASRWGLEISGIAAIDVDNHFAFHLEAVQTPGNKGGPQPDENLLDWYGHVLYARKDTLFQLSSYIVAVMPILPRNRLLTRFFRYRRILLAGCAMIRT